MPSILVSGVKEQINRRTGVAEINNLQMEKYDVFGNAAQEWLK
jgi:hypothetical protein